MKLLAIADVHADPRWCSELYEHLQTERYDAILGAGDWYNGTRGSHPDTLLRAIAAARIPVFFVTGNHESAWVLKQWRGFTGLNLQVLDEQAIRWNNIVLCGIGHESEGGVIGGNRGIRIRPRLDKLDAAWRSLDDGTLPATRILLTHEPPFQHNRLYLDNKQDARNCGNRFIDSWARTHGITHIVCGHYHREQAHAAFADDAFVCNPGPHGFVLEFP